MSNAVFHQGAVAITASGDLIRLVGRRPDADREEWRHDRWDCGWKFSPDTVNEREITPFTRPVMEAFEMSGYHFTDAANLEAIMSDGLAPSMGQRSLEAGERHPTLFLFRTFEDAEDAMANWLGESLEADQIAIMKVAIPNGTAIVLPSNSAGYEFEVIERIPPAALTVLSDDLDNSDWGAIRQNEVVRTETVIPALRVSHSQSTCPALG